MKKTILATVSIVALLSAIPALAETIKTNSENNVEVSTTGNIVEDTKIAIKDIKDDVSEAYDEIKATLIGGTYSGKSTLVVIDSRITAKGIINHYVYNEKQESVARITDIILDKDGKSIMVVVSEELLALGTKSAFNYSSIISAEKDGSLIMPLSEKVIESAKPFSYDKDDGDDKVHVIPDNGYSVVKLLDGGLVNQKKEFIADVDNISFKDGVANQIIVNFDKALDLNDGRGALYYSDTKIIRDGEKLDFQLSADKAALFELYKKNLTNDVAK